MIIKICGIKNLKDAELAVRCGATHIGFIFYEPSVRYISPEAAGRIARALPADIEKVGVFVNCEADEMLKTAETAGMTLLQLHGDNAADKVKVEALSDYPLIKALQLENDADLQQLDDWPECQLLIDSACDDWGGSGKTGNWKMAAAAAEKREIILAGGLHAENVAEALAEVKPAGVDVSSGVEAARGVKDPQRIKAFIEAVKKGAACDI